MNRQQILDRLELHRSRLQYLIANCDKGEHLQDLLSELKRDLENDSRVCGDDLVGQWLYPPCIDALHSLMMKVNSNPKAWSLNLHEAMLEINSGLRDLLDSE